MLRTAVLTLWCLVVAFVFGAGSVWVVVRSPGYDAVVAEPWVAQMDGAPGRRDPYAMARVALGESLTPGRGEVLAFVADNDSAGQPLRAACRYRIAGLLPPARIWTLRARSDDAGLNSLGAIYDARGALEISAGRLPEPGNWLRTGPGDALSLTLALYDLPAGFDGMEGGLSLPSIERVGCDG
jgi:hypothetical protein